MEERNKLVLTAPGLSNDPPRRRECLWGMETIGKLRQIEVTENSLFYWSHTT